ncbi:MAG: hypothetical protein LBR32_04135 [Propionibacteriaceae bacterium]|nr:hypothetical protein [Propionibacteriaceae bacterium]
MPFALKISGALVAALVALGAGVGLWAVQAADAADAAQAPISDSDNTHTGSFSFYEILFAGHLSVKDETGRMKVSATYGGIGVGGGSGSGTLHLDPDGLGFSWDDLYTKTTEAHIYSAPATMEIDFTYTYKDNSGNYHQDRLAKFTASKSYALGTMDGPAKKWQSY